KTSVVKVLDLATGKELAKMNCPEKGRYLWVGQVSPDGAVVAVHPGREEKGAPIEVWFLDTKTLEDRASLVGKGDPKRSGCGTGLFSPDGKHYVLLDGVGKALLWDVAGRKLERTLSLGGDRGSCRLAISPEGKTLAAGWAPEADPEVEDAPWPDPQDLPQP